MPARWQYEVSAIEGHSSEVREHLAAMAEDGWELVNGSVTSAVHPDPGSGRNVVRLVYVQYWRRPVEREGSTLA
jgi:hypothetical protein